MLTLSHLVLHYKGSGLEAELGVLCASAHHSDYSIILYPPLFNTLVNMPDWESPEVIAKTARAFQSPPFTQARCANCSSMQLSIPR